MRRRFLVIPAAVLWAGCAMPRSRSEVDPHIANAIERTKAIDNHAHPTRSADDQEFDAIPVSALEASSGAVRVDAKDPRFAVRKRARDAAGMLDAAGIEIMLANRIAMGAGLDASRFRWVPFADALMYPLNNQSMEKNVETKAALAAEEKLLKRYLSEAGLGGALPAKWDEYLAFVTKTLERHKQQGAVAEKFEMAYLRTLEVGAPQKGDVERVYNLYSKSAMATDGEYKAVQDAVFRHIALECGRLGMAVHIHSSAGAGSYFSIAGANPMLLEPMFNDAGLRKTQFVLVHGGWPATREAGALLTKPNVWLDFSGVDLLLEPRVLAGMMREWLGWAPDKVLFGTDAGPWGPGIGLEESLQAASAGGREALGLALTGMVRDGEMTHERAETVARMVLRDNARRLYGMK